MNQIYEKAFFHERHCMDENITFSHDNSTDALGDNLTITIDCYTY